MKHTCLMTAAVAALLLAASLPASAQSRRERWNRSERGERDAERGGERDTERGPEREAPGTQPANSATSPGSTSRPATMEDQYGILLKRSIFARSGIGASSTPPPTTTSRPTTQQFTPEQAVVFRGVLAQGDEFIAFAENQTTQQLMILRNGDDVANGKVVAITLDTIAYGAGGAIKEVHVGQNLAGDVVASASSGYSTYTPSTAPASTGVSSGTSPPPSSPEQAAILERLRQRRQSGQ